MVNPTTGWGAAARSSASHADGVLSIELAREAPEALKPRRIQITTPGAAPVRISSSARAEPLKAWRRTGR